MSGHSDLVAGYVAGSHPELMAAVERERLLAGAILGPFEAWLALRSLGSAGLRFERQCHNALAVALMLRAHPAVRSVRYPGLPDDPAHEVACRSDEAVRRPGERRTGRRAAVHELVERSALLVAATSFGGIHTSVDRRARWGDPVADGFARISLGIEDTDDLLADIEGGSEPPVDDVSPSDVTFSDLEMLVAFARTEHFGQTAAELGVSVAPCSALSAHWSASWGWH